MRPLQSMLIDEILPEFLQARVGPCVLEGGLARNDEVCGVFDVTVRYQEYATMISHLCAPYTQVVHIAQSIPFTPFGHGIRPGVLASPAVEVGYSLFEPTGGSCLGLCNRMKRSIRSVGLVRNVERSCCRHLCVLERDRHHVET